jgi:hypothetical protein
MSFMYDCMAAAFGAQASGASDATVASTHAAAVVTVR